jgi:acetyl/propionyl-CoA carboxylase alpha subunit
MYYDPLVAKVTAWGRDRAEAIRRMRRALTEFKIVGVETNIPFHVQVMASEAFQKGELHTDFIEEHYTVDAHADADDQEAALIVAALLTQMRGGRTPAAPSNGSTAGWKAAGREQTLGRPGWRRSWR